MTPLGGMVLPTAFLAILQLRAPVTGSAVVPEGDAFDNAGRLRSVLSSPVAENLLIYLIHGRDNEVVLCRHRKGTLQDDGREEKGVASILDQW